MGEPAVPAPDRKMPATYRYIVGTRHVTVSAFRGLKKVPDIVTPDLCKCSGLSNIFNAGDKDTGCTAVVTCHLRLVRNRFYDLVCHLLAVIAVRAEFCKNEPVTHGKYWMCPGSLICCIPDSRTDHARIRIDGITQLVTFFSLPVVFDSISDSILENFLLNREQVH